LCLKKTIGHEGESWTIQCEVSRHGVLGGGPLDEDPAPNEIIPNVPFDFFGLRQVEPAQTIENENQAPEPAVIQQQQGLANA